MLNSFSLSGFERQQRNLSGANVISISYNGERLGFIPGTFDTVLKLVATIRGAIRSPNFSFRDIEFSAKYGIVFGKYEGITFLSKEVPSFLFSRAFAVNREHRLGRKWTQWPTNWWKMMLPKLSIGKFSRWSFCWETFDIQLNKY